MQQSSGKNTVKQISLQEMMQIRSYDMNTSVEEFAELCSYGVNVKLVDVLEESSYEREHIKGAISIPLKEIREKAKYRLKENDIIITYCANYECPASTEAAKILMSLGYKNVFDYKGGLADYRKASLPLEGSWHALK